MLSTTAVSESSNKPARIQSLDQFRGYSVAAMFIVNFVGGLAVTHHVLKHNNTHFSYADSIMPSFLFACGYSYRMSFMKRLAQVGQSIARRSIVRRSLGLISLSAILTAFNSQFPSWNAMNATAVLRFIAELFKANLWEVLAIIGAVQIMLLPVIGSTARVRVSAFVVLAVAHTALSWSFNEAFVYGKPNWMDNFFGAAGKRAWDGGFFGLISWAEIMLAGTFAYDIMSSWSLKSASRSLIILGVWFMIVGYGMSCLTRLYDRQPAATVADQASSQPAQPTEDAIAYADGMAKSPVIPDFSQVGQRPWASLLAEPPLVPPPGIQQRAINYWMMDKRMVTQSFVFFSIGFALTLYGLFVIVCDLQQRSWSLFNTFGQNPLAAYIIHHLVAVAFWAIVPKDSPLLLVLPGLLLYFVTTYMFVRFLEQRKLFLRL